MEGDEGGALGEATGQEEPSAGCCGEFRGGNGALEVVLCMGHPGLELSAMNPRAVVRENLLEERHLSWAEDEARGTSEALRCLPKTSPSRDVYEAI